MGRGRAIKPFVRPPFLARRHGVGLQVIWQKIRAGEIHATPTRVAKRTGLPSGFMISRREVDRLDRVGLRPRVVVPAVTIADLNRPRTEAVEV